MKKRNNILKEAVVFLIIISMFFSTIVIANTKTQPQLTSATTSNGSVISARGDVVWDNDMDYDGFGSSQIDTNYPFISECADDFFFEENTEVGDVHWVGVYWYGDDYNTVHWPWIINFYNDDGTGTAPSNYFTDPILFSPDDYTETLIEDTGDPDTGIYYEISVNLPENILFYGGSKYWISIQGVGFFPPQSGIAYHYNPILMHEEVFKSVFFGYPDWTPFSEVDPPNQRDMCFQLTEGEPPEPDLDCYPDLQFIDVKAGQKIQDAITIENIGDPGSLLDWELESIPDWGTGWTFNPSSYTDLPTGVPQTVIVEFNAPAEKNKDFVGVIVFVNSEDPNDPGIIQVVLNTPRSHSLYFDLIQQIINRFPILKILFK